MIDLLKREVIATYNKAALHIDDPVNEVLLVTVQTQNFGAPIVIDTCRHCLDCVDKFCKIITDYDMTRFNMHFRYIQNVETGEIRPINGDYVVNISFFVNGGVVDGGIPSSI